MTTNREYIRRTNTQKEADRAAIAALLKEGKTHTAIAQILGMERRNVSYDAAAIIRAWRAEQVQAFNEIAQFELAKLDRLERRYLRAWRRSCKPKERIVQIEKAGGVETRTEIIGQAGDPRFLDGIRKVIADRRKLLGIDAPIRIEDVTPPKVVEVVVTTREEIPLFRDHLVSQGYEPLDN